MSTSPSSDAADARADSIDIAHLRQWVGRETRAEDTLSVRHARLMAATLGRSQEDLVAGAPLPPLWHWLYFLEGEPPERLGRDGHPARGGFLPPVPLPNRMWAGGSVDFHMPVPLDSRVEKRSRIESVEHKRGRTGDLVFVGVRHELRVDGALALSELHDIVYKPATAPTAAPPQPPADLPSPSRVLAFAPDSTLLFRYSALTFNGHRIHYDLDYCRQAEGYPNLVVHGPLSATLLAGLGQDMAGRPLRSFRYRGLQPAFAGQAMTLNAAMSDDGVALWTGLPGGAVSMRAQAVA